MHHTDPYRRATYSFANRLLRLSWGLVSAVLFRPSPRPFHGWRCFLLRLFGAQVADGVHPYPSARIWAPWNLVCEEASSIGDGVVIYNPKPLHLGSHAVVSQDAFICGATHDYEDAAFPTVAFEMRVGAYAWICARACLQPGVNVGDGAVLALASVATRDLEPWTVYGGMPARAIKKRILRESPLRGPETFRGPETEMSGMKSFTS